MDAKGAAILVDPHPCGHIVYPYTDENLVSEAISLFATAGLHNGEAVILIMTRAHCEPVKQRIESEDFNVAELQNTRQLTCLVAEELLGSFTVDGVLDEAWFRTIAGDIIKRARANTNKPPKADVRIFGEMVSLLWGRSDIQTATRVEELWNELIESHGVSLLCTYSLSGTKNRAFPRSLIDLHSANLSL